MRPATPGKPPATIGADLAAALRGLEDAAAATALLTRVSQLVQENEGLAEEVLASYEQLNLIFDVAQQVAHLTRAGEIERVLASRIGVLLGADRVQVTAADGGRRAYDARRAALLSAEAARDCEGPLAGHVEHVRATRQVCVASFPRRGRPVQAILGPLLRLDGKIDVLAALRGGAREFTSGDMLMLDSVLSFGGQIISNSELHEKLGRMSFEVTRALVAAIDQKDHYTSGHSERVGFLARLTGRQLGLGAQELQTLEWAGLLHDVGKIGIPEEILNKPGKLTRAEFETITKHPRMGYDILKPIASFEGVLQAVLHHHEAPDGSGYPDGLTGDQTPLMARIVHVVDIFDALTSTRSYRDSYSVERACEIIRNDAGTKVDAAVAGAFLEAIARFASGRPQEFHAMFVQRRAPAADAATGDSP